MEDIYAFIIYEAMLYLGTLALDDLHFIRVILIFNFGDKKIFKY